MIFIKVVAITAVTFLWQYSPTKLSLLFTTVETLKLDISWSILSKKLEDSEFILLLEAMSKESLKLKRVLRLFLHSEHVCFDFQLIFLELQVSDVFKQYYIHLSINLNKVKPINSRKVKNVSHLYTKWSLFLQKEQSIGRLFWVVKAVKIVLFILE